MKKLVLYFGAFVVSLFCGVFLWDRVPGAQKVMQATADYSIEVLEKSCRLVRKVSGFEKLQVFERRISSDQALALFPEYMDGNASAELTFVPHLLMHVRFSREDGVKRGAVSQEGMLLWNLVNGEMVLNTGTWSCSKGFRECLMLRADRQDVCVMQTLASLGGAASKESLTHALTMKNIKADKVIRDCQRKKLIFTTGGQIGSHFQQMQPIKGCTTTLHALPVWLRRPRKSSICQSQYSQDRVRNFAGMIFGNNFLIINSSEVFVPVYKISLTCPDNSIRIEYVNAVTGKLFQDL
ncbi:putative outer membrane protein [Chlamydia ibidis]|uniref:Outer membrane protein n=2 Tax=Chlamydia ibidis TaxID=1405396 RepID=A0ABN0MZU2_9CHLA|nr:hypothetical protein [Chlamydia ibidis]EPP34653.1 putative outer membrane protein [Chlamydia ibidis]EQM62872.1 putative outer membrane protein [Chlamydia ibidis 10-1398/6]